jgi:hypothetical protein
VALGQLRLSIDPEFCEPNAGDVHVHVPPDSVPSVVMLWPVAWSPPKATHDVAFGHVMAESWFDPVKLDPTTIGADHDHVPPDSAPTKTAA